MRKNKLLLLVILLLGIGFATVSTTLLMTGNVKIATNNADFDVKFTKAVVDGTDISSTAISEDGKTITFSTKDLSTVGDISKLDFEVTNNSEMYDANVSIDCTAAGDKSSYYEITKEVASPILGKTTEAGKVEVKLSKASSEDFSETFTCTLEATATERTEKAEPAPLPLEQYTPKYFAFGNPTTSSTQYYRGLMYPYSDTPATVFVGLDENSQKAVCIIRNDSLECFRVGTAYVAEEQEHLQRVFSDTECVSYSSGFYCSASDFNCEINSDGTVGCTLISDHAPSFFCYVSFDGNVNCG